jgi:hypothetical protein
VSFRHYDALEECCDDLRDNQGEHFAPAPRQHKALPVSDAAARVFCSFLS